MSGAQRKYVKRDGTEVVYDYGAGHTVGARVVEVYDAATGEVVDFKTQNLSRDLAHIKIAEGLRARELEIHESTERAYSKAAEHRRKLNSPRSRQYRIDKEAPSAFDVTLPEHPLQRRAAFLNLALEDQAMCLYRAVARTNSDIERVCKWLMIKKEDIEWADHELFAAAKAECELRVAAQIIEFATRNFSPTALTAAIYASKQMGWSDGGPQQADQDPDALKSLFTPAIELIETHRDPKTGKTLKEPTVKPVVLEAE